jgi:intein/homing endonuclease
MACKINIDQFDDEQLASIEKELTLPLKNTGMQQKFVYPFNLINKMVYLPFSYATTEWDIQRPLRNSFSSISTKFDGKLRDEQVKVKNEAISSLNKSGSTLMSMYCGFGKCLGYDTPVLCFDGSIKKVQNITTEDKLMGDDNMPRNVLSLSRGKEKMYCVDMLYGDSFTANQSHILSLYAVYHHKIFQNKGESQFNTMHFDTEIMDYKCNSFANKYEANLFLNTMDYDPIINISIENFLKLPQNSRDNLMAYRVSINFEYRDINIDPYFIGIWLGIGNEKTGELKTDNLMLMQYITERIALKDIELLEIRDVENIDGEIKRQTYVRMANDSSQINRSMNQYGLLREKKIPTDYLVNSKNVRLSVLAGLIDSCGKHDKNMHYITVKSLRLCDDILYLTRSLGFNSVWYDTLRNEEIYYIVVVITTTGPKIPVLFKKNHSHHKIVEDDPTVMKFTIIPINDEDYYGFEIDGNRRFLLGDFTVTHNTITSINLACTIGLKTMIVMNRIVLMNQWEKSIKSVCPNAIVQKINVKEKRKDADFYIVNAINIPKMEDEWFSDIGTAIIDECFTYDTRIMTSHGSMKIGEICSSIHHPHDVLSFNEDEKKFEFKSITNTFKTEVKKKIVTVRFLESNIRLNCTEDHLFLTTCDSYKKAKDLKYGEKIVATYDKTEASNVVPILTKNQRQIIFGCFLAGNEVKKIDEKRYAIIFEKKQLNEYIEDRYVTMRNGTFDIQRSGLIFDTEEHYFDENFSEMMNEFDSKGLAVWYMESYAFCHSDVILVCHSKLKKYLKHILNFFERCSITVIPHMFKNVIFFVIHNESVCQFFNLVNQYIWTNRIFSRLPPFVYGYLKIESVTKYDGPKQKYVYDIEVEDNHNFVVCNSYFSGGIVVHNCHTIVAETLSKSLLRLTPRYLIGLSATPYRPDEMDSLIRLYFGENKIVRELFRKHTVYMVNTKFKPEMKCLSNGKLNWGAVLDSQATNKDRNDLIIKIVGMNTNRNFLILTKRVEQARYLIENLVEKGENVTNLVGSKQDYDPSARILVATIQKVSCGFDHAKLDTLLLAADTEEYYAQVLGRIFRTQDTEPLVFDLVDDNPVLRRHFELRREVYRKHGGLIRYIEY